MLDKGVKEGLSKRKQKQHDPTKLTKNLPLIASLLTAARFLPSLAPLRYNIQHIILSIP